MLVIGVIVICNRKDSSPIQNPASGFSLYDASRNVTTEKKETDKDSLDVPEGWTGYSFGGSFEMAFPPSVELRGESDDFTKHLRSINVGDENVVVFQQAGLSTMNNSAMKKYCRIMIQEFIGRYGDYLKSTETDVIGTEATSLFNEMVHSNIGNSSELIGEISYKWRKINGAQALQIDYLRSVANFDKTIPVVCRMAFFQNNNKMVRMTLSYRKAESGVWSKDFETVLASFRWTN